MVRGLMKKRSSGEETKADMVYLHLPAMNSEWSPNIHCQSLAVETFLKIHGIIYEPVYHDTSVITGHSHHHLPSLKFNNEEIVYSNHMFSDIAKKFGKTDTDLAEIDHGAGRAFQSLFEDHFAWVLNYLRTAKTNQLPITDAFQGRYPQFVRKIAENIYSNKLKTKTENQGIGHQTVEDVLASAKDDLRALSAYLDAKSYFGGESPNKLDATAFAHLSQFYYAPGDNDLKTYVSENCSNLAAYLDRIKTTYWSDWQDKCRKPPPPKVRTTTTKSEKESENGKNQEIVEKTETVDVVATTEPGATNGCDGEKPKEIIETKESTTVEIVTKEKIVDEKSQPIAIENGMHPNAMENGHHGKMGATADVIVVE